MAHASVNGDVITVTTSAGSVKVQVSGSTTSQPSVALAASDETPGERVTVGPDFRTPSSAGQVNAGTVIFQPANANTGGTDT